jgi:hypothetical protein
LLNLIFGRVDRLVRVDICIQNERHVKISLLYEWTIEHD